MRTTMPTTTPTTTPPTDDVIACRRIGERSSHAWLERTHRLGYGRMRDHDGSWTEWGNAVRAPIEKGT